MADEAISWSSHKPGVIAKPPMCGVCHQRPMQHQLATAKTGFNLVLCYPCFDALRDIMAMYLLQHGWQDAAGNDYLSAMEQGSEYQPIQPEEIL